MARPVVLFDNCYCDGGHCGGEGHTVQTHSCERVIGGSKECWYRPNQPVGSKFDCVDEGNLCGILGCYALNTGVCYVYCYAAVGVCLTCPGSQECTDALVGCYDCLTGEGIDCGCLVMDCVPSKSPSGTHYEEMRARWISESRCAKMCSRKWFCLLL